MANLSADTALAQDIGSRARQEDAVVAYCSKGTELTIAVLSDGMGGHKDGDLASRIIAREMFGELYVAAARPKALRHSNSLMLRAALSNANHRLAQHVASGHISDDTGGTVVCVEIQDGQMRWLSVGDSLLYLMRDGRLKRLNQLHLVAAQLDMMVAFDQLDVHTALSHPDRYCLTSAVTGQTIPKIDCPDTTLDLQEGDVVLVASDGIDVLEEPQISSIIEENLHRESKDIADEVLCAVRNAGAIDQDNTSVIVIKIGGEVQPAEGPLKRIGRHLSSLVTPGFRADPSMTKLEA
ncbi:MAG: protein phosphatase 2C domain-containing protein [Pseudomonadota bacterium]